MGWVRDGWVGQVYVGPDIEELLVVGGSLGTRVTLTAYCSVAGALITTDWLECKVCLLFLHTWI